jgi:drug/metabolite transporter superfamily protein YnfA
MNHFISFKLKKMTLFLKSILYFVIAGLCEIEGGNFVCYETGVAVILLHPTC